MKQPIDPTDFIISRKRKKYKFARFFNAENCFEFDEWQQRPIDIIELGAGTGFFSVALAERYPDLQIAAIDVKADRLQKGAYQALEKNLNNISFIRARADQIDQLCPASSIKQLWLTFPDPFPKKRSTGRRLTHPIFLAKYASLLDQSGALYLKHDDPAFFQWSLEQLVSQRWHIDELSFDVHAADVSADYKVMTSYERRWLNEGRLTQFVRATPPQR